MSRDPTYTAMQLHNMAKDVMDLHTLQVLLDLMNEELSLYSPEDMGILTNTSLLLFNKTLLIGSLSKLNKDL